MKFSRKKCMDRCRRLPDAYERATCCADCRALHAAILRRRREAKAPAPAPKRSRPIRSAREKRWDAMFGTPTRRKRKKKISVHPLAGVPALRDAASDRRDARATAAGIAAAAILACQALENTAERGRCVAAANAALAAANTLIDEATRDTSSSGGSADEALEELRRELEDVQSQAEIQREAEIERERERREAAEAAQRQQEQESQRTLLLVGGGVTIALALGLGYVLLSDDGGKEAA